MLIVNSNGAQLVPANSAYEHYHGMITYKMECIGRNCIRAAWCASFVIGPFRVFIDVSPTASNMQ